MAGSPEAARAEAHSVARTSGAEAVVSTAAEADTANTFYSSEVSASHEGFGGKFPR